MYYNNPLFSGSRYIMLTSEQKKSYLNTGYVVLEQCFSAEQMGVLKNAANEIVANFDPSSSRSVFSTEDHSKTRDDYFLSSGDKVRCFLKKMRLMKKVRLIKIRH